MMEALEVGDENNKQEIAEQDSVEARKRKVHGQLWSSILKMREIV